MTPGLLVCQIDYHDREMAKMEIDLLLRDAGYHPENISICEWPRKIGEVRT